jgi:hypothetical protein
MSFAPEAKYLPSGENATEVIKEACPLSVATILYF